MKTFAIALVALAAVATPASAQTAAPAPVAPPAPAAPVVPSAPAVIPVGTRVGTGAVMTLPSGYNGGIGRDPFVALVQPRLQRSMENMPTMGGPVRTGLAALTIADVNVTGITTAGSKKFAIVEGPNKMSFVAKPQDKLLDGSIKSIDATGVVFSGQSGDELRKTLRPMGAVIR